MIPNGKKIYLCQPDLSKLCVLNGLQTQSVDFHPQVKGYSELSFVVDRFINIDGQQVESNGYEDLKSYMYIYLEDFGYFIMDPPQITNDGTHEEKSITAYSAEKEFENRDWVGIKINYGTVDSMEYSNTGDYNLVNGFAERYVTMVNTEDINLSFLHQVLLKVSSKWNIQYVSPSLVNAKIPMLQIDSENLYAVMTSEVGPRMSCLFVFDYLHFGISVYSKDEIEMSDEQYLQEEIFNENTIDSIEDMLEALETGVFGNIDLNNREVLTWDADNIVDYMGTLPDYRLEPEIGSISTVLGGSDYYYPRYNGNSYVFSVAYSPLLQTGTGIPRLISKETLDEYIYACFDRSFVNGSFNSDTFMNVDKSGLYFEVNGRETLIRRMVAWVSDAEVGNAADIIGEVMHYRESGEIKKAKDLINGITSNQTFYTFGRNFKLDTGIFIGFRNLQNSVDISVDSDSIFTRFYVEGEDSLDFRDVNFGENYIINLDYFLADPYMDKSMIAKFRDWEFFRECYIDEYVNLTSQRNELMERRDERITKVPSDETYWKNWDSMSEEGLRENKALFEKYLTQLRVSVDDRPLDQMYDGDTYLPKMKNGEVDDDWYKEQLYAQVNIYGGYYTYCEIIEYILPYINLALSNLNKIDSEKVTPENTSQTNWELYGLDELDQVVRQSHEDQIADLQRYSKAWNDMTDQEKADTGLAYTDDDAGANYENLDNRKLYLKLVAELGDENTPGTILYQLKVLRDEIAEIEAQMEVKQTRLNLLAKVAKYDLTRSELLECGDSEIIEARSTSIFTERELCAINTLLRDTDYVNSNILVTNIMSLSEKMVIKQELLEDARGKLSEVSQPQYKFSVNMDNFFRLPDYEVWANEFAPDSNGIPSGMLKFIRVGIRDDYMVKLRVIGYRWNPCEVTSDLTFEFSSMITGRTGRSDLTELLDQENNRGSKNSIRIGTGTAESEQEYINNIMELLKTNSIFTKAVQNIAGGVTGAVDPTTIENIIHNYISGGNINGLLSRVSIDSVDVGNITGLDGKFQDLAAEYITAGYIQSKIIDAETGKFKWLEAIDISAKTITADQIVAQGAEFTELASKIINAQQARIENIAAGTITANSVISAMGDFSTLFATNAFIEHLSTQTSSTIVSTVDSQYIKNQIVQHLTASDILAGDIVLSNSLRITSEDGGLIMNGQALQILGTDSQGNTYVGVQLGYDTSETPSLILRNEDGTVILSPSGITQAAIADQLIIDDMIRDGTISKDKLSFEILETNENGGIDIGMIYNGDGGRFGEDWATFTQMTQTALDKLDLVAPQIELSGPNIFIDSDGTIEPESVTITAKLENGTEIDQWLLNGKQNTSYVSEDGLSITIPSGEVASKNIATVQVLATNGLYDTMSIYKLSDSATGQDAYSVIIDNENILISTDQESRTLYHQSFGSQINVYHNLEKTMEYTINEQAIEVPAGLSLQINTNTGRVTVSCEKDVYIPNMFGAITIPIEIDGYTFTKAINYNLTVIGDENKKYTWIIYADNRRPLPSEIMLTPEGARYVGIATDKDTNVYSELFTDYEWFPLNNTGDSVSSVQKVYYKTLYNNAAMIPEPSEEALALGVSDEILNFDQGVLAFKIPHWTQDKPDYTTGYYLWTSLRVRLSNGTYFYTTPVLSEEWGDYLEIGGTQLIRNSKTLIDTRIYWY